MRHAACVAWECAVKCAPLTRINIASLLLSRLGDTIVWVSAVSDILWTTVCRAMVMRTSSSMALKPMGCRAILGEMQMGSDTSEMERRRGEAGGGEAAEATRRRHGEYGPSLPILQVRLQLRKPSH